MHRALAICWILSLGYLLACDPSGPSLTEPAPPSQGSGQGNVLSVPFVGQQTDVWCWAAVSEMVLRYYGRPVAQCQILSGWFNADCCTLPFACRTTAPIAVIQQTLLFHGVRSNYVPRALTFSEVAQEIDSGRPMILAYRGSFAGHVVVLFGYEPGDFVFIHDPFYGTFTRIPYGASFNYGGQLTWSETLVGIG